MRRIILLGRDNMKSKLPLSVLLLLVVFAGACKSLMKSDVSKLVLTYKPDRNAAPVTKEVLGKQSFMTVYETTSTANGQVANLVVYAIYITNYDADVKISQSQMPKADGQIKVEIQVIGAQGSTKSTPLKVGTYNAAQFDDGVNKFNKTLDIRANIFENGAVQNQGISIVNTRKGFVKINSVDEEKVSGEVDMSDDFRSVKGEFSAKIVKSE